MNDTRRSDKFGIYVAAAFVTAIFLCLFVAYRGIVMLENVAAMNVQIAAQRAKLDTDAARESEIEFRIGLLENSVYGTQVAQKP